MFLKIRRIGDQSLLHFVILTIKGTGSSLSESLPSPVNISWGHSSGGNNNNGAMNNWGLEQNNKGRNNTGMCTKLPKKGFFGLKKKLYVFSYATKSSSDIAMQTSWAVGVTEHGHRV